MEASGTENGFISVALLWRSVYKLRRMRDS
jgi:hypothetical protein